MRFKEFLTESKNSDYTVYFDLDSTVADFHKKALEYNPQWTKKDLEQQTMSDDEFSPNILKIPNFWKSLEPIKSGMDMLKYAVKMGYNVEILSSPSRSDPRSVPEKHLWVKKHLGKYNLKVNLVRASMKQNFAHPNALLVDDLKLNVKQFNNKGGHALLFKDGETTMNDFKKALLKMTKGKLNESIDSVQELDNALSKIASGIKDVRMSKHFVDRLGERGIELDTVAETIEKFFKRYENSLKQSHRIEINGLIKHMLENLNLAISYNTKGTQGNLKDDVLTLVTAMKKKNFVSHDPNEQIYKVR